MNTYIKTMVVTSIFIVAIAMLGFKSSVDSTANVLQKSLNNQARDAAALVGQSLNGVDIETEIELTDSLIKGAYALGSYQEVTLYGKPAGDNQNLRMQNKKDIDEKAFVSSFFELKATESFSDIVLDGAVQGKVLVKSDVTEAYKEMEKTVAELIQLFAMLGFGAIAILAVIIKFIVREAKS
jgi:hypothetical protein